MSEINEAVKRGIAEVLNKHSIENNSNTPDFILAEFLSDCLVAFEKASNAREKWYGKKLSIEAMSEPECKSTNNFSGLQINVPSNIPTPECDHIWTVNTDESAFNYGEKRCGNCGMLKPSHDAEKPKLFSNQGVDMKSSPKTEYLGIPVCGNDGCKTVGCDGSCVKPSPDYKQLYDGVVNSRNKILSYGIDLEEKYEDAKGLIKEMDSYIKKYGANEILSGPIRDSLLSKARKHTERTEK